MYPFHNKLLLDYQADIEFPLTISVEGEGYFRMSILPVAVKSLAVSV